MSCSRPGTRLEVLPARVSGKCHVSLVTSGRGRCTQPRRGPGCRLGAEREPSWERVVGSCRDATVKLWHCLSRCAEAPAAANHGAWPALSGPLLSVSRVAPHPSDQWRSPAHNSLGECNALHTTSAWRDRRAADGSRHMQGLFLLTPAHLDRNSRPNRADREAGIRIHRQKLSLDDWPSSTTCQCDKPRPTRLPLHAA